MTKAQKVRALRKLFRKVSDENEEGYEMSMAMGGGECHAEICDYFQSSMRETADAAFQKIGMTYEEYEESLHRLMKVENHFLKPRPERDTPLAYDDLCIIHYF